MGNGFASGLDDVSVESGSIRFAITGFGDEGFVGDHTAEGDYEVFVDVHDMDGQPIDSFSQVRTLAPGIVHEYLISDAAWSGGLYNVNIDNRHLPNDIDYFTFTGLVPGAEFAARTLNPSVPILDTFMGWFDDAGMLIDSNDDYGVAKLSQITGVVPASGMLTLAVTGFGDFGFEGLHSQAGGYDLLVELAITEIPGNYNGDLKVDAADYTYWRNRLDQSLTLNGEDPAAETPGLVDLEDYSYWKLNYGAGMGGAGAAARLALPVPEPDARLLAVMVSILAGHCRRREL
jgi:hypothetical protein